MKGIDRVIIKEGKIYYPDGYSENDYLGKIIIPWIEHMREAFPFMALMEELGLKYHIDNTKKSEGGYYYESKYIVLNGYFGLWMNLMVISHELGHALQSPQEFEVYPNPTLEQKHQFIMDNEIDAWDKGAELIRKYHSKDVNSVFWIEYEKFKTKCLNSYWLANEKDINRLYKTKTSHIFEFATNVKPIDASFFENIW